MSKNRLGKRIVALAVAATMTLSTVLTGGFGGKTVVNAAEATNLPKRYDSASAVNYSTILGRGVDFGVVAESFVQKGHMQTTFATLKFANYHDPYDQNNLQYGQFNAVDLIEPGSTGQILIGSVDTSGDRAPVPIVLDNPKSGRRVHIEAPAEVIGSYDGTVSNGYFYTANINNRTEFVDALVNESTVSNIKDIHTRAKDASEMLSAKASDEDYRINYKDYFTKTDGGDINNWKILDFSNPAFDNRVIYIDVDNDLLKKIGNGGFEIIKNSSSVIVFNISPEAGTNQNDSIFLSQYKVTVKDENVKTETTEYSDYDKSRNCDEEIAQKVIWNVTSKKKVFLHNTTGLFLVPNSEQVDISGTSAGWIVTKNFQNSNGEWHYIYAGGSQDVPVHKPGQMHFAIDKAYTYDWNNGNPVADTSLIVDPDTFTFEWYEVKDDSYDTTDFLNYKTTQNKSTSKIQLPIETFYSDSEHSEDSHYVPEGTTKSFYYVLKEKNAGEYVKGIGISKGYVNIKLDVTNKNGKITFSVTYDTYLGDEKNTKSDGKVNDPLAGVEYDLDNFFNKIGTDVEIDKVSVAGGEEISDATLVIRRLDGETFDSEYPTVSARNIATGDKVQLNYVDKIPGSEYAYNAVSYVTTGEHTIISGLEDGRYSLTEIINPLGYAIAEPIVFEVKNGVISSQSPDVENNKITMIDEHRTSVAFSKKDASNMDEIAGAEIRLYGGNADGAVVFAADNFSAGKGASGFELLDGGQTLKFVSGTEASIFKDLPDGIYTIHEEVAPNGYIVATDITFNIVDGVVYSNGSEVSSHYKTGEGENSTEYPLIQMNDDVMTVRIKKKDLAGEEIVGAKIKVTTDKGKKVDEWESDGSAHEINYISAGKYILTEEAAPEGYEKIKTAINFTVDKYGNVTVDSADTTGLAVVENGVLVIKNAPQKHGVLVSKVDAGGTEIAGAKITVTKKGETNPIDSWTSEENVIHEIKDLEAGNYILKEVNAPAGYDAVKSEIEFSVNKKGEVEIVSSVTDGVTIDENGVIVITNNPTEYAVSISKVDAEGTEIAGAEITVTKKGETTPIDSWTSEEGKTHTIEGVTFGDYVFTEINAPEGYKPVNSNIEFTVNKDGSVTVTSSNTDGLVEVENGVIKIKNLPKEYDVAIKKTDLAGVEIAGAEIKVTKDDADKTLVDSWTSEEGKNHIIKGVTFGDYILTEVNAPEGYDKVTTKIKFKVNKDGSVSLKETYTNAKVNFYGALQITNEPTKFNVSISKTDAVSGEEIAGAEIKVTKDDKDKTEVDSWTSKKNETHKIEGVTFGNYVLTEVNAPEGYDKVNTEVRFSVDKSGKVIVTSTNTNGLVEVDENGVLVIKNIPYVHGALISKQDLESGEEIEGAVITITKADDETVVVDSWTSEAGKKHEIQNIVAGDYVLIEETSPEGYVKVTSKIEFTVDENGKITVTSKETDGVAEVDKNGVLVIKNAPVKHDVAISKVDATDGSKELEGATIVIYNEKKAVVDTWVSADAAHVSKISAGRYTLKETVAPDDYDVVESEVIFDVDKAGNVTLVSAATNGEYELRQDGTIVIKDSPIKKYDVNISKQDLESGDEIGGAEIVVTKDDADKTEVDKWTSVKDETHTIKDVVAGDYILTEVNAPEGYEKVTTEIKFKVDENGKVTVTSKDTDGLVEVDANGRLVIKNKPEKKEDDKFDVNISKQDLESGDEIGGAEIVVTKDDADKTEVDKWTSVKDKTHTIKDVVAGDYILTEVNAPEGYEKVTTEIKFKVDENGKVTVTSQDTDGLVEVDANGRLVIKNKPEKKEDDKFDVNISKQDLESGDEIGGAEIVVTKDDADKTEVDKWTSVKDETHTIKDVVAGDYILTEVNAPEGYEKVTTEIKFKVDENGKVTVTSQDTDGLVEVDANGRLVIKNKPEKKEDDKFDVNISKQDLESGDEIGGAEIVVTKDDADKTEVDKWTSVKDETHTIKDVVAGDYILTEVNAPEGYEKVTTEIKFKVDENGKVTVTSQDTDGLVEVDENGRLVIKNKPEKKEDDKFDVNISKQDLDTGDEIPGAEIVVTKDDKDKTPVDSWTSVKDETHTIKDVVAGDYILTEVNAPEGYEKVTTEIKFTVDKDGKVTVTSQDTDGLAKVDEETGKLIIFNKPEKKEDDKFDVNISKQDLDTGDEIPGAEIVVTKDDVDKTEVDKWTSVKDETHTIKDVVAGDYILTEVNAPEGYEKVTTEIKFTVDKDGKVTVTSKDTDGLAKVDEETGKLIIYNKPEKKPEDKFDVNISKQDLESGDEIGGAEIVVTKDDKDKTPVDSWTSVKDKTHTIKDVTPGEYILTEVNAPEGYEKVTTEIKFKVDENGKVTVTSKDTDGLVEVDANGRLVIKNKPEKKEDDKFDVNISKQDLDTGDEIPGAEIVVTKDDADKTEVDKWTSVKDETHTIKDVVAGDYILTEVNAPEGYEKVTTEIKFTVDKDGKVTVTSKDTDGLAKVDEETGKLIIYNKPEKKPEEKFDVNISKQNLESGDEIGGAEIVVTKDNTDKTEVDKWTSVKDETHTIKDVVAGDYILTEVNAPEGYEKVTTEIKFTVDKDGKVTVTSKDTDGLVEVDANGRLVIKNKPEKKEDDKFDVNISKQDLESGDEIGGAEIVVTKDDKDKTPVDSWTSVKDKTHTIKDVVAGDYILTEVNAPEGYEKVTTEIKFKVDENGKVTVTSKDTDGLAKVDEETGKLIIFNKPEKKPEEKFDVNISKQDLDTGDEIPGAEIVVTKDDKDKTPVDSWTSVKDKTHTIKDVVAGDYILTEVNAPEGYEKVTTEIKFTVDKDGKVTVTSKDTDGLVEVDANGRLVIMNKPEKKEDDKFDVNISKQDLESGDEIGGAEIVVTKDDKDKTPVDSWTSVKDETHTIKDVVAGDYILTEVNAPEGYEKVTTEIKFTVDKDGKVTVTSKDTDGLVEVDANGRLVIKNKPEKKEDDKFDVNISKQDLESGDEIGGAEIVVTKDDKDKTPVDSWTSVKDKTHTIKDVVAGDYILTEVNAPEGYEKVTTEIKFKVDENGKVTVTSQDTDGLVEVDANGRLVIKNKPEKKPEEKFDVNISKQDLESGDEIGGAEIVVTKDDKDKTPVDSWTSVKDETHTIKDVVAGDYILTEVNAPEGYEKVTTEIKFTVDKDGKVTVTSQDTDGLAIVDANGRLIIKNKPIQKTGSLVITKSFANDCITDEEKEGALKFTVTTEKDNVTYYLAADGSLTADKTVYTLEPDFTYDAASNTWTKTFDNVPVGTYTVEEVNSAIEGYEFKGSTFNGAAGTKAEIVVDADTKATEAIVDDYTRETGNLIITKLVKGPVTEEEFNGALTFKIVDEKGNPIIVTKNDGTTGTTENMTIKDYFQKVSQSNGEFKYELKIESVPTGNYTVTETNTTFGGYELVRQTGGGEVNVVNGKDVVEEFTDEYNPVTGLLEIVKNFQDAPSNLDASKLVFKVEGPARFNNGEALTVTYDKFTDGKYVIKDAPIGNYTVTETSYEESLVDGTYKYSFNKGASTVSGTAEVIKETTASVSLKNVYDKEEILGSLTINKTVAMNDGSEVPADTFVSDKTFKVSVQNTDTGLYVSDANGGYSENPVWFDIKADSAVKINNIKLGNYTVSEDVADATRVDYRIIYDGSASTSEAKAALSVDAKDGNVTISNVYKHYEEEEIIDYPVFFSKEDSLSGAEVAGAEIALYKGDKAEGTPYKTWTSTLTSHVENLEEGTYTFKETVAPTGYDIVETAITFTVEKDETADKGYSVKLIDLSDEVCYQRQDGTLVLKDDPMLGILKVVKVVETNTGNKPVVDGFNVTVKNLKNNKYVQSVDGKLGDEAKDIFVPIDSTGVGSVEITGLRPARYLVVEKEDGKAVKGFVYDANGSIAELEEEIALTDTGATTAEVELTNKYVEDIGSLSITKKLTGDNPGKTEFKVTVKNSDGKFLTADGKLSDSETVLTVKAGETLTINNVPSGKYTVAEDVTDASKVTGYKFNSENSVSAKDATVTQGSTAAVELINDYTEVPTGNLYVHVKEEKSGKDVPDATVTVTNKTTGDTTEYKTNEKGEIVDNNGKTPELPEGEYTVVVSDVPKGYEVTTGESADVTVPKNDTGRHEAVIKTTRGGIIITVYDEETGNVVPGAEVTITTPDGVTKTFVIDSDGQVKEYAKKDQFDNYTQLPGTFTYVVTKVPEGYKVTTGESQTGTVVADKLTELVAKIAPKTGGLDIKVIDEKTEKPVPNATVEVSTPDGQKIEILTDKDGMITKFVEKDATGNYTAKVGEYKITVTKVPEGYSVKTGQTKTETVVEGQVKHHVARIATATQKKITDTDTTNNNTTTNKTNTSKKTDTNAKTADEADVAGVAGLMIISLAAVAVIVRRKKEDEE